MAGCGARPGAVAIPGVSSRELVMHLDALGLAASRGSACSSGEDDPSPALVAMGLGSDEARGALRLTAGLGYTWHDIETDRRVAFGAFDETLRGDNRADTVQLFGEAGYRLDAGGLDLEPFAGLARVHLNSDGSDERGGDAALSDDGDSTDTTFSTLGLRAATGLGVGGVPARLHGTLGWRHAFGDTESEVTQSFAGGQAFTVRGVPVAEDAVAAAINAGIQLDYGDSVDSLALAATPSLLMLL